MKKKWIIVILLVIVIGMFAGYQYIYKGHRDISSEEAEFTLTVPDLQNEFIQHDSLANEKYSDKTIVISGTVTAVDAASNTITIDDRLSATLEAKNTRINIRQQVRLKGRIVGYDDLLEELKMDQAILIN